MDLDSGRIHMVSNQEQLKALQKQFANLLEVKPDDMTKQQFQARSVSQHDKRSVLGRLRQRHIVKIGRNSPCPCGSGKKYKKCCLR